MNAQINAWLDAADNGETVVVWAEIPNDGFGYDEVESQAFGELIGWLKTFAKPQYTLDNGSAQCTLMRVKQVPNPGPAIDKVLHAWLDAADAGKTVLIKPADGVETLAVNELTGWVAHNPQYGVTKAGNTYILAKLKKAA